MNSKERAKQKANFHIVKIKSDDVTDTANEHRANKLSQVILYASFRQLAILMLQKTYLLPNNLTACNIMAIHHGKRETIQKSELESHLFSENTNHNISMNISMF